MHYGALITQGRCFKCVAKHGPDVSSTEEVTNQVLAHMRTHASIEVTTIRLSDSNLPVGLRYKESEDDEWPHIVDEIKKAEIVIFATPIWWGNRSSLMQRVNY